MKITKEEADLLSLAIQALEREENDFWSEWSFSEEQMKARYEQCEKNECGLFRVLGQGGVCAHDDCGCLLSTNRKFLSKLSWASSKCPEGYWGPTEEKDSENTENGV